MPYSDRLQILETRRRVIGSLFWIGVAVLVLHLSAEHVRQAQDVLPRLPEKQGIAGSDPAQPSKTKEQPKPKQSNAQNPAGPPVRLGAGVKSQDNTTSSSPEANNPDQYKKDDLEAQRRMAVAAENLTDLTKIEIGLLIMGTAVLLVTIIYSIRSYRLSANTAERQLRAYLFVEDVRRWRRKVGDPWMIELKIKNFGQTPAYRVTLVIETQFIDASAEKSFVPPAPTYEVSVTDLAPGHTQTTQQDIPGLSGQIWNDFKAYQIVIFFWGRIDFVDAYGRKRWIRFRLYQNGGYLLNLSYCAEGNETSESVENDAE